MPLRIRTKTCLQLFTLAWVITWVATVPLFHTHLPDVNDGRASHQGLAHTVFSPDLPVSFPAIRAAAFTCRPDPKTLRSLASSFQQKRMPKNERMVSQVRST